MKGKALGALALIVLMFASSVAHADETDAADVEATAGRASEDQDGSQGSVEVLATGLLEPTCVAFDGVHDDIMYVCERAGRVLMFDLAANAFVPDASGQPKAFLDLRGLAGSWFQEMGLLSIAFHPDFAQNGYVYVGWVDQVLVNHVDRFRVGSFLDPQTVDLLSRSPVMTLTGDVLPNHNGGLAEFGPDGYLYYGVGDGGLADDPLDNGQNTFDLFGNILRVDVDSVETGYAIPPDNPFADGAQGAPEVWAYGLRNPWRFSFHEGDLWIGDVGQNQWEEIDVGVGNPGGVNWGWPLFEGAHPYLTSAHTAPSPPVGPVTEYSHNEGCSVTGGYVYEGSDPGLVGLVGKYTFADYCSRTVWSYSPAGGRAVLVADSGADVSTMGEGPDGTLYVAALGLQSEPLGGWVGRIVG